MTDNKKIKKRVLVAMSGGVDSSVSASLLLDQGYEVVGVTMQVWDYSQKDCEEGFGTCCSSVDVEDARRCAGVLGIPFYVINCESQFKEKVISPFLNAYNQGETPIPCLECNTHLKFHHLIQKMKELDCDYLATGHYAQIKKNRQGRYSIYQSEDGWKDQTYFLFTIQPKLLPQLLFPVGGMNKTEIRKIAEKKKLPVFNKKDSTGLCFIGRGGYVKFFENRSSLNKPGKLKLYPEGKILGEHTGIHNFTYGQRKRLGVSSSTPLYVVQIDPQTQDVWLGEDSHLYQSTAEVFGMRWLDAIEKEEPLKVKIRFQHKAQKAHVYPNKDNECLIQFEEPQRAVTPGQAAVIYRGQQLIGGGTIRRSRP